MAPFSSDVPVAGARAVGSVLAGCAIEAVVQVGPVYTVYRAGDALGAGRYALKEYCPQALCVRDDDGTPVLRDPQDAAARAAFEAGRAACQEELRLLSRLRLPGLVTVLQASEAPGSLCALMPWLPGVPLAALPPPRDAEGVRELLLALLEPLAQLHTAGLVHGGLDAWQLLWVPGQRPVLLGFKSAARALRRPEVLRGAAPELRPEGAHLPRGPWSDLYALAATVLDHLGAWPSDGVPSEEEIATALVRALPPSAGTVQPALAQALRACLRSSPTERPAGAVALCALLGEATPGGRPPRAAAPGGRAVPGSSSWAFHPAAPAHEPAPRAEAPMPTSPAAAAAAGAAPAPSEAAAVRTPGAAPAREAVLDAVPDGRPGALPPRPALSLRAAALGLLLVLGMGWAVWWGQGAWQAAQERRHVDQLLAEAAARTQQAASSAPEALGLDGSRSRTAAGAPVDGPAGAAEPSAAASAVPPNPNAPGAGEPLPRADGPAGGVAAGPPARAAQPSPAPREAVPPPAREGAEASLAAPVARAARPPDSPLAACVTQAKSALERCMRLQCARPAWHGHVQCERWLEAP